MKGDHSE